MAAPVPCALALGEDWLYFSVLGNSKMEWHCNYMGLDLDWSDSTKFSSGEDLGWLETLGSLF